MRNFGLGKRPKHKKFNYLPRFYDEQKEELEKAIGKYNQDPTNTDMAKRRISAGLRQSYVGDDSYRKAYVRKSNRTIFYVIIILSLITYLILKSDAFLRILESFTESQ